jgi:hypothetical protein
MRIKSTLAILLYLLILVPVAGVGQSPKLDGEYAVELTLPLGDQNFTMVIDQKGNALTGHMVNEFGQFDLTGAVDRDQIKLQWSFPDGGRLLNVTFTGKLTRDGMTGRAKVESLGDGPMEVRRK